MKIKNTIYLDHQASTPTDVRVLSDMEPYYRNKCGNPHSSDHIAGWQSAQAVEEAAGDVAALIGAERDEIIFTSGATESNNQAILGTCIAARNSARTRLIVSATEHKCVLAAARAAQDLFSMTIEVAPVDSRGLIDPAWLKGHLDNSVLLVSAMAVNNEIGTIQDIRPLAQVARNVGALFHTDCAQAPLAMDLSDMALHADLISLSGHKMYGPKGVGALFVKRSAQQSVSNIIFGGGQQDGMRSGTVPTPLVVGMATAARLLNSDDADLERKRYRSLRDRLIALLVASNIEIIQMTPPKTNTHPANINIRFVGINAHDILQTVQPRLAASTGSACTSGTPEPSHVLRAIGLAETEAEQCIRFSVGRETTEEHIDEAASILIEAISHLALATQ